MKRTVLRDPRAVRAKEIDLVVRKDGYERRIEADWIKKIAQYIS